MTGRLCTNQQHPKHLQDVPCRVIGGHCPGREAQLAGKHRPVQRCSQHMRSLQVQARAAYASRAAHTQATARLHRRMINQDATQLHAVVQQSHSSSSNSWAPAHIRKPSHPKYNSTARDHLSPTGPCERCSHDAFHTVLMAAKLTQRPFPVANATCCVNSRHSGLHTCGKESRQWQVSHAGVQFAHCKLGCTAGWPLTSRALNSVITDRMPHDAGAYPSHVCPSSHSHGVVAVASRQLPRPARSSQLPGT
jgi:hypothetical protein